MAPFFSPAFAFAYTTPTLTLHHQQKKALELSGPGRRTASPSSESKGEDTAVVLEEEFGSMDVTTEIEKLKSKKGGKGGKGGGKGSRAVDSDEEFDALLRSVSAGGGGSGGKPSFDASSKPKKSKNRRKKKR